MQIVLSTPLSIRRGDGGEAGCGGGEASYPTYQRRWVSLIISVFIKGESHLFLCIPPTGEAVVIGILEHYLTIVYVRRIPPVIVIFINVITRINR